MTKSELLKKVRAKCLDCCCDSSKEVEKCVVKGCSLYDVRLGKDPTKRVLSEEEKTKLAVRLSSARKTKTPTHTVEGNSSDNK